MSIITLDKDLYQHWEAASSGLYLPPKRKRSRFDRPIGIDLFCGAGGFSLGFIQAGFQVLAGVDHDPICMQTYMANLGTYPCELHWIEPEDRDRAEQFMSREYKRRGWMTKDGTWVIGKGELATPDIHTGITVSGSHRPPEQPGVPHFFLGDVRKLSGFDMLRRLGLEIGEVDCLFGGPPCQGFSIAGKQNVMDPRNSLVFEFARLVCEIQPKAICFENVPNILNMVTPEGIPVVDALCQVLEDGGFGGLEALKRSLVAHPTMGMAKRKPARRTKPGDLDDEDPEDDPQQLTMFGDAA